MRHQAFRFLAIVAALVTIGAPVAGRADEAWPSRVIRIIVPFQPGGATDVLTRVLSEKLAVELKQPVIVENRGGAGGNIGAAAVANAPGDGYTFLMGAPGTLAYNKVLYKTLPYEPHDFVPVSLYARFPNVLVVNPDVPAKTVAELIAYAKANPNKLNYAAIGLGATSYLSVELLKSMANVDIQYVSYSATTLSMTDLMAGRVQLVIDNLTSFLPLIRDGRVRALGISTAARSKLLPDVPTISEAGVPGYEASSWIMLVAPKGTPQPVVRAMAAAMKKVTAPADFEKRMADLGAEAATEGPEQAAGFLKQEEAKWGAVVTKTGAKLE